MSRKGSGFRLDQNIGRVSRGPVRRTMRMAQMIIANHGFKAIISPCRRLEQVPVSLKLTEYKLSECGVALQRAFCFPLRYFLK